MLVLDEPTASLDANETELLFQIVRDLKARGIAIVFITHFIDQVYEIADRISVLRNGRLVGIGGDGGSAAAETDLDDARARARADRGAPRRRPRPPRKASRSSWPKASGGGALMAPFDLSLRAGEVVGLAGLLGSGRTEVAKLIFGAMRPDSGRLQRRRRADDDPFAAAVAAPGDGVLSRGPQGRGPHRANSPCARTSSWRCRPSAAGCGGCRTTSRRSWRRR